MRLYSSHQQVAAQGRPASGVRVVAIGNFDGVHRGHQQLLEAAAAAAGADPPGPGGEVLVLSFWPHPARVLAPSATPPPLITTRARKRELIAACGVDGLLEEPFTLALAALSPESFVTHFLLDALHATHVCVGYDFTFGKNRAGDNQLLAELLQRRGARLCVVPAFTIPGADGLPLVCSSTRVRKAVQAGDVDLAARVLGRPMELEGVVVPGAGRGRTIGVPTANLAPETELAPATGVYAAWAEFPDPASPLFGRRYQAAINVGYNPTFSTHDQAISMEAHLLRAAGDEPLPDLYGQRLRLGLVARLRAEQRFPSVEALVQQIRLDIDTASALLSAWGERA